MAHVASWVTRFDRIADMMSAVQLADECMLPAVRKGKRMFHVQGQLGFVWDGKLLKLKLLMPGHRLAIEPGADQEAVDEALRLRNVDRAKRGLRNMVKRRGK